MKSLLMKENNRKTATKLLLVNWSRFSNVTISLEGSTLFTGVNGSGKSTILDAMTYMLTGNTQFNKAALDRDRNVISYVRGDTKSEGKNRFLREGEITSYIAMEFWDPSENNHIVVGVCIEYVNETNDKRKWFVFKDTKLEECKFYTEIEGQVTVYPRIELIVKGKKVLNGEFMNRDKGVQQVLRALGLRCEVSKYKSKLVKMMSFNPENNIDKFIQECVLEERKIESMNEIRTHRDNYNIAIEEYQTLHNGKDQLVTIQKKIEEYEIAERKYETRRLLLKYQDIKYQEDIRDKLSKKIQRDAALLGNMEEILKELEKKKEVALQRKITANQDERLSKFENNINYIKSIISSLQNDLEKHNKSLELIKKLEKNLQKILDWMEVDEGLTEDNSIIVKNISSTEFSLEDKTTEFIKLKALIENKKASIQREYVHISDEIEDIGNELTKLYTKITQLESNVLTFDEKYERAKKIIREELEKKNIKTDVRLFSEFVEHIDKKWQLAIETFLGRKRFYIIVDGRYCAEVMDIVHKKKLSGIDVVITDKLPEIEIKSGSASDMLEIRNKFARRYANYLLNGIHLCENIEELHEYPKGGLMADGTLAKSYAMTCMDVSKTHIYMGQDAVKEQLKRAKIDKKSLEDKKIQLGESVDNLSGFIKDIESINWDETAYDFDVVRRIRACTIDIEEKENELNQLEKTPELLVAIQERDKADRAYEKAENQFLEMNNKIVRVKQQIEENTGEIEACNNKVKEYEAIFNKEILLRLELKKDVIDLYNRLRIKNDSAVVLTPKTVENTRGEKDAAVRNLENEQRKYWHIQGQSDERIGIGYISFFREEYRNIAIAKIEEANLKLEEVKQRLENTFMTDFVAQINEAIREAKNEIYDINKALKDIPFGKDTYQFKMIERQDRKTFFDLYKKIEIYVNNIDLYRSVNKDDEEMEYNIRLFMDEVLAEENEEEFSDYRQYFKYDMSISSREDDKEILADLSKKQGSASNGEKQTPYFIILAASLLQCYPKNVYCARLAFIDEAFSALSKERIEQMVKFFEDNCFQVIYAAPPEKIDSIGSHINSTISLCMKGKYTWAIEGLVKSNDISS